VREGSLPLSRYVRWWLVGATLWRCSHPAKCSDLAETSTASSVRPAIGAVGARSERSTATAAFAGTGDPSEPSRYQEPVTININTTVEALAVGAGSVE
jgi:hypothetical protein